MRVGCIRLRLKRENHLNRPHKWDLKHLFVLRVSQQYDREKETSMRKKKELRGNHIIAKIQTATCVRFLFRRVLIVTFLHLISCKFTQREISQRQYFHRINRHKKNECYKKIHTHTYTYTTKSCERWWVRCGCVNEYFCFSAVDNTLCFIPKFTFDMMPPPPPTTMKCNALRNWIENDKIPSEICLSVGQYSVCYSRLLTAFSLLLLFAYKSSNLVYGSSTHLFPSFASFLCLRFTGKLRF